MDSRVISVQELHGLADEANCAEHVLEGIAEALDGGLRATVLEAASYLGELAQRIENAGDWAVHQ